MRVLVFYRRRDGRQRLRIGTHVLPDDVNLREFQVDLLEEYNRTRKRVEQIETRPGGLEETLESLERVELMLEIKRAVVAAM
jgi:hypothetical protein